jgi:AraC-like DNA-binding protein
MGHPSGVHDRNATTADRDAAPTAAEVVRGALDGVRLRGSVFLRAEFTEGWAYESPTAPDLAGLLVPGRERLVLFHIVAAGSCWIALPGGEPHRADAGDVIVLPYGDQHCVSGTTPAECVPVASLLDPPPWTRLPVIRYGAGGARTDIVCGYLDADDPLFDPRMAVLPPVFVVTPVGGAARWVEASIAYAVEQSEGGFATSSLHTRLPELLLVEVLRLHLATAPAGERGWLAALRDPVLAPALAAVHRAPDRKWTVPELAAASAVSRSLLDERFRRLLGSSPMQYVTHWRMHVAKELLSSTDLGVRAVARRVGYDSEEAFSRAFKRALGRSPTHWRAARAVGAP